jgi:hypothetical protein
MAHVIVPPYQAPDEPGQFAQAYGLSMPASMQPRIDQDVLRSMVRHGWFDFYEDPPPDPLPESYEDIPGMSAGLLIQPLYYGLAAVSLWVSQPADLESAYVHLRVLSVLLSITTLIIGWAGSRLLLGEEIALGATTIAVLHPQFLLASISVNADALLNVFGAFVWWQAARVVTRHRRSMSIALMVIGGVAAMFTKRVGMVLIGIALVVACASSLVNRNWRVTSKHVAVAAAVAVVAVLVWASGLVGVILNALPPHWSQPFRIVRLPENTAFAEAINFARMTLDYFWLIGGWLRFQPPATWLWVARIAVLGGLIGAVVVLIESRALRPRLFLAWLFVVAQLAAMFVGAFLTVRVAPQARYLFPAFIPITVVLYVGLKRTVPLDLRRYLPALILAVLVLLDVTGFTTVHIPTYVD